MIGRTVSHFRITAELGRGGMGVVYEAEDTRLQRQVALKFLSPHLTSDHEARARFLREAQTASSLEHPAICSIFEIGETEDGQTFLVMPRYRGETLEERLTRGPVPQDEAVRIITQVGQGLAKAHGRGIVHRDLKPGNIFLTEDGQAVILDFGLAKLTGASLVTQPGSTVGTGCYMSPEQVRQDEVDQRSDIWALGVVLYEMLSGERPFRGDYLSAVAYAVAHEEPRPLAELAPRASAPCVAAVTRALAKDPAARPRSVTDFLDELVETAPARRRPIGPARFRPVVVVAAAVAIVALAIALGLRSGWFAGGGPAVAPVARVDEVAVLRFDYSGDPELAYVEDGAFNLLINTLDGIGGLRTVGARTILLLRDQLARENQPFTGEAVARRLGIGSVVTGSIVEAGGRLRVAAELHRAGTDAPEIVRASVNGTPDDLFALIDELTGLLCVGAADEEQGSLSRLAATTGNLEALKAYLEADRRAQAGDTDGAVAGFEHAVALDSTFALAWYRLSQGAMGGVVTERALDAATMAARYSDELPTREKLLFRGWQAFLEGDIDEAERHYREALALYPHDALILERMAGLLWAYNLFRGRDPDDCLPFCQRHWAITTDPTVSPSYWLYMIALKHRDWEQVAELQEAGAQPGLAPLIDFLRCYDRSPVAARDSLALSGPWLERDPDHLMRIFESLRCDPEVALAIADHMIRQTDSPRRMTQGYYRQTVLRTARGRLERARISLDRFRHAPQAQGGGDPTVREAVAREIWAQCLAMPYLRPDAAEVDSVLTVLDRWDAAATPDIGAPLYDGNHELIRLYLAGMLAARLGRWEEVAARAAALDTLPSPPRVGSSTTDLAQGLRARIAFQRGDPEQALAILEAAPRRVGFGLHWGSDILDQALERLLRGDVLFALGRFEEAWPWYDSAVSYASLLFYPIRHLKLARTAARLGQKELAAEHYGHFIAMWADCDPAQRALLEEARAELAAL